MGVLAGGQATSRAEEDGSSFLTPLSLFLLGSTFQLSPVQWFSACHAVSSAVQSAVTAPSLCISHAASSLHRNSGSCGTSNSARNLFSLWHHRTDLSKILKKKKA